MSPANDPALLRLVYLVADRPGQQSDFYSRALSVEARFADGEKWVQLASGAADLAIADTTEGGGVEPGRFVPVFEVADLDETARNVAAFGGRVEPARDMGDHGTVATAYDPSGVPFCLFSRRIDR